MTTSNPTKTHDSPQQTDHTHQPEFEKESLRPTLGQNTQPSDEDSGFVQNQENNEVEVEVEEEEEEEGECGFCLFMKAGGCRDSFIEWEKCVEESEKNQEDIVEKCHSVTKALKECMEAHPDHYGPILQAEKAAQEVAESEMEREIDRETEREGNVGLDSQQKVENKPSRSVSESEAMIEVEGVLNESDSEVKSVS